MAPQQLNIKVATYRVTVARDTRWLVMTAPSTAGPLWQVEFVYMSPLPPWRGTLLPTKQATAFVPLGAFGDGYHLLQTEDPVFAYIWYETTDNSVFDGFLTTSDEPAGEGFADPRATPSPWLKPIGP